MTAPPPTTPGIVCPACEIEARGRFCANCGADLVPNQCLGCRQSSPTGSQFCVHCGAPLHQPTLPARRWAVPGMARWVFGGLAGITVIALVFRGGATGSTPLTAPTTAAQGLAAPPDLSTMSPKERFERLYQRIITAAQQGDRATADRFLPMALAAYGMLDSITVDARYHLAMLQLHVGDLAGAQAQADTIRRREPTHLFGIVVGAAVARWSKKDQVRDALYRDFIGRYETEMATRKPEYLEHQAMLAEVRKTAGGGAAR